MVSATGTAVSGVCKAVSACSVSLSQKHTFQSITCYGVKVNRYFFWETIYNQCVYCGEERPQNCLKCCLLDTLRFVIPVKFHSITMRLWIITSGTHTLQVTIHKVSLLAGNLTVDHSLWDPRVMKHCGGAHILLWEMSHCKHILAWELYMPPSITSELGGGS